MTIKLSLLFLLSLVPCKCFAQAYWYTLSEIKSGALHQLRSGFVKATLPRDVKVISSRPVDSVLFYKMVLSTVGTLTVYCGNHPNVSSQILAQPFIKINGLKVQDVTIKKEGKESREVLFYIEEHGVPCRIHYYYSGLTSEDRCRANSIINSTMASAP